MDYFTQTGILSPDQVDGSYDGTPAGILADQGPAAQQGFGSAEPCASLGSSAVRMRMPSP